MERSWPFVLDMPADFRWAPVALAVTAAATPTRIDLDRLEDLLTAVSEAVGLAIGTPGSDRVSMEGAVSGDRFRIRVTGLGDEIPADEIGTPATTVAGYVLDALADELEIDHGRGRLDIAFSAPIRQGFEVADDG